MKRRLWRLAVWGGLAAFAAVTEARAQGYGYPAIPRHGQARPAQVRRGSGPPAWWGPAGNMNAGRGPRYAPGGTGPGFEPGLPRGRRYYGGRYFGSFNNRFYSPQYGDF